MMSASSCPTSSLLPYLAANLSDAYLARYMNSGRNIRTQSANVCEVISEMMHLSCSSSLLLKTGHV